MWKQQRDVNLAVDALDRPRNPFAWDFAQWYCCTFWQNGKIEPFAIYDKSFAGSDYGQGIVMTNGGEEDFQRRLRLEPAAFSNGSCDDGVG